MWAKNLADPSLGLIEKPMLAPFYFFPDNGQPKYTEYWSATTNVGMINFSFCTTEINSSETRNPDKKVKLRYILIPQQVLKENKQSSASVRRLSYTQLTSMLGIGL